MYHKCSRDYEIAFGKNLRDIRLPISDFHGEESTSNQFICLITPDPRSMEVIRHFIEDGHRQVGYFQCNGIQMIACKCPRRLETVNDPIELNFVERISAENKPHVRSCHLICPS